MQKPERYKDEKPHLYLVRMLLGYAEDLKRIYTPRLDSSKILAVYGLYAHSFKTNPDLIYGYLTNFLNEHVCNLIDDEHSMRVWVEAQLNEDGPIFLSIISTEHLNKFIQALFYLVRHVKRRI